MEHKMKMTKILSLDAMSIDATSDQIAEISNVTIVAKSNKTMRFYQAGEKIGIDAKMPKQLQQILTFLATSKFKGTGAQIIEQMIAENKIETKQNPAVLFAFYARRLESLGIIRS